MISIDLATRFLWEDHQVFVLHPGKSKKFYGDFISQNRVFLDFPGVRLPRDIDIASSEFRATLRMGREIARWYTARDGVGKEPSRDFRDHLPKSGKFGRARYANEAEGLYSKARRGDLVICPGPGYRTHVYIGEFVEDFDRRVVAHAEIYEHEPIPARRVTWLSSSQTKAQFSDRLIQLMQNPAALIQIASHEEKQEVYDLAYGDYTLPNQGVGRVLITKEHIDLHDLNESSEVISYFVAMFRAQDQQQLEAFFKLPFWDAIDNFYDRSYLIDTRIDVRSPGLITLRAKSVVLPVFVGIMLVLASLGLTKQEVAGVELENSALSNNDDCQVEVTKRVREALNMMGLDRWKEMCEERLNARETVGQESSMSIQEGKEESRVPKLAPKP